MNLVRQVVSILLIVLLAACGPGGSSASPGTTSAPASSAATRSSSPPPSPGTTVTQTETSWGRIWDGLPAGFPTIPGATPDEEATGGPASAVFVVEGTGTQEIVTFLQSELQKAGYTSAGSTEPLEDGSYVLDMTGAPEGCMLQATVKPTGGLTTVTILYGTDCPFG